MSSMALHREYRDFDLRRVPAAPWSAPAPARRGIFRRILAAITRSDRRHAEEAAGHFIATHGGRLTDDIERQLTEHFNRGGIPRHTLARPFRPFADW